MAVGDPSGHSNGSIRLISGIYLVAQLVGAGAVIEALAGISFPVAVLICGVFMVVYIVFGGMLARFNFSPGQLLD